MDPSHLFMNRPHILYVSNFGRNGNPRVLKIYKNFWFKNQKFMFGAEKVPKRTTPKPGTYVRLKKKLYDSCKTNDKKCLLLQRSEFGFNVGKEYRHK